MWKVWKCCKACARGIMELSICKDFFSSAQEEAGDDFLELLLSGTEEHGVRWIMYLGVCGSIKLWTCYWFSNGRNNQVGAVEEIRSGKFRWKCLSILYNCASGSLAHHEICPRGPVQLVPCIIRSLYDLL